MNKIKLNNLDLEIYKEVLDNGLLVYMCPMKKNDAHASFSTKFGNDILKFKPIGKNKFIEIPPGTAHFLEHKMFETEKGEDPMTLYSNNGASSNAYTTSNITRYYFTGASHFFENLKILLDCITNPYFTKENIAKEQGIIKEEINSGFDNPGQRIYYLANENLFVNHPHKHPVAGYVESIAKLNEEILYDTYNTFYHPNNMYLVITGNINPKETIKYIKEYFKDKKYSENTLEIKKENETEKVKNKTKTIQMDITNKIITKAYKIKTGSKNKFLNNIYLMIYLDILFSEMSEFYNKNHKDKNILKDVDYFINNVDDYTIIYFDTEVKEDIGILSKIDEQINKKEFTKEDFDLIVKNIVKSAILATENVGGVANLIVNQELNYNKIYNNFYDIYKNLDYEKCQNYIKKLDFSNNIEGIIEPLENKLWHIYYKSVIIVVVRGIMMNKEIQEQIAKNEAKIDVLIDKEMLAGDNLRKGMVAIFGTGTVALASIFTPIPIKLAIGAYAAANIYTFGSLWYGCNLQTRIDNLHEKNEQLKNKYVLVKETKPKKNKVKVLALN